MNTVGVIASRYGSSRLPGKALEDICGRPMVWWVYQSVRKAGKLSDIFVATDDERIVKICDKYNIPSVMTGTEHREAANRLWEISQSVMADFYIQVNGDEPLLDPNYVDAAVPTSVPQDIEYGTNLIARIGNPVEAMDASNIKVVFDDEHFATYMSRTPIPYPYRSIEFDYYKHIGIIGYNKKMLDFYHDVGPGKFEIIEGIATLRFIDYGKKLKCVEVEDKDSLSVDTRMDLEHVKMQIAGKIEKGELEAFKRKILKGE